MSRDMQQGDLIAYSVIQKAISGDAIAMEQVISRYRAYIRKLSQKSYYDPLGNEVTISDYQLQKNLELHLIIAVLKFKIR